MQYLFNIVLYPLLHLSARLLTMHREGSLITMAEIKYEIIETSGVQSESVKEWRTEIDLISAHIML
jgi:hypothetical protein